MLVHGIFDDKNYRLQTLGECNGQQKPDTFLRRFLIKFSLKVIMVIDHLVLSEYVCRYKNLNIYNAIDGCLFTSNVFVV